MDKGNRVERLDREMIRPKRTAPTTMEGKARTELEMCPRFLVRCLAGWWDCNPGGKSGGPAL